MDPDKFSEQFRRNEQSLYDWNDFAHKVRHPEVREPPESQYDSGLLPGEGDDIRASLIRQHGEEDGNRIADRHRLDP